MAGVPSSSRGGGGTQTIAQILAADDNAGGNRITGLGLVEANSYGSNTDPFASLAAGTIATALSGSNADAAYDVAEMQLGAGDPVLGGGAAALNGGSGDSDTAGGFASLNAGDGDDGNTFGASIQLGGGGADGVTH